MQTTVQNSVAIAKAMVLNFMATNNIIGDPEIIDASDWFANGGNTNGVKVVMYEPNMGEMACFTVYNNGVEVAEITLR